MPNKKISQLPLHSNPSSADFIPVVSGGSNLRLALSSISTTKGDSAFTTVQSNSATKWLNVPTDLSQLATTTNLRLSSSTGNSIFIAAATSLAAGLMSAEDKINLTSATSALNAYGFFGSSPTVPSVTYEYLSLAGGGGGGGGGTANGGGGGGAGGFLSLSGTLTPYTNILVEVGAGGPGGTINLNGQSGSNTTGPGTATGGGGGGAIGNSGFSGGSGGGAGGGNNSGGEYSGGNGIDGQGFAGGYGTASTGYIGGGGGGAGGAGGNYNSGIGGAGRLFHGSTYGSGGTADSPSNAQQNSGNGGGGGNNSQAGGNGGSGIVVIRYPGLIPKATGGSVTQTATSTFHTFTASGVFKWLNT